MHKIFGGPNSKHSDFRNLAHQTRKEYEAKLPSQSTTQLVKQDSAVEKAFAELQDVKSAYQSEQTAWQEKHQDFLAGKTTQSSFHQQNTLPVE